MLLQAKISIPGSDRPLLRRDRLLTALDPSSRLLFVNGPAGSGKTSLVLSYVTAQQHPVTWYSLDSSDADPTVFLRYLTASLAQITPEIEPAISTILEEPAESVLLASAIAQAINSLLPQATLVLDDLHNVEVDGRLDPTIGAVLNALLRYCTQLQIVIASRQLLNLDSIITLLARGEARGLDGQALAFTPDEIDQVFVETLGEADPHERERLSKECAGWTTAVALALTARSPSSLPMPDDHTMLYAYLANQVLGQLPTELSEFLIDTAVLDYMSAARCDFLRQRSDSANLLAELVRRNIFVTSAGLDNYRYHPLFREFLLDRLRRQPARYQRMMNNAIDLAQHEQRWEGAFDLSVRAERWDVATALIGSVGQQLRVEGRHATLMSWLRQIPASHMGPSQWWLKARLMVDNGQLEEALIALDFAARGTAHDRMLAQLLRALIKQAQGQLDAAADLVAPYLDNTSVPLEWQARIARIKGVQLGRQGDHEEALRYLEHALTLGREFGELTDVASISHDLGVVEENCGRLDRATQYYKTADACWKQLGDTIHRSTTLNSLGVVLLKWGRLDEASDHLQNALELAERFGRPRDIAIIHATLGDIAMARGEFASANAHYHTAEISARNMGYTWLANYAIASRTHSTRLQGDRIALNILLDQLKSAIAPTRLERAWVQAAIAAALWTLELPGALGTAQATLELLPSKTDAERPLLIMLTSQILFTQGQVRDALSMFERLDECLPHLTNVQTLAYWAAATPELVALAAERGLPLAARLQLPTRVTVATPTASPALTIRTLGAETILRGSESITGGGPLTREVFFCLLAAGDAGIQSEELREQVWGENGDVSGQALKTAIKRIRRDICDVLFDNGMYHLRLPPLTDYDVQRFQALLRRPTTPERLKAAIEMYRGGYLPRIGQMWAAELRTTLEEQYIEALVAYADHVRCSDAQAALEHYRMALRINPYHVGAVIGAMYAEAALGRRAQALGRFQTYATHMVTEFGIDPDQAVSQAYRRILNEA